MSCSTCPELVLGTLRADANNTLRQVREVKALTTILNRACREITAGLIEQILNLVALIPGPPMFDLSFLKNLVTCPLTPQAFVTDWASEAISRAAQKSTEIPFPAKIGYQVVQTGKEMTAEAAMTTGLYRGVTFELMRIANQIENVYRSIRELIANYFDKSIEFQWLFNILFRYCMEVWRIVENSGTFACRLALTTANGALVKSMCPDLYNDPRMPYKALVEELSTFSFDGVWPNGTSSVVDQVKPPMSQLMFKLQAWQSARSLVVI